MTIATRLTRTVLALGLGLLLGLSAATGVTAQTMRLGWATAADGSYGVGAERFKQLVESYTDGSVEVKLFCCFKLGSEQEQFKALQLGTQDATIIAHNNVGPFFPLMDLFVLPYIFQGRAHAEKVISGPIGEEIKARMLEETGVRLLDFWEVSFRNIFNSRRPIESLEDVAGLRYRVPKNPIMIQTYKAFGANPTPLAWSETFTAVQTGTVDGGDLPVTVFHDQKFQEVAKHMASTQHFVLLAPLMVSDRFFSRLSAEQQAAVQRAAEEAGAYQRQYVADTVDETVEKLKGLGVRFTSPDKGPFIEAAREVWRTFEQDRGEPAASLLQDIAAAAE